MILMNRCKIWMIGFFIKNDLKKWGTYLLNLNWPFEGTHLMSFFGGTKC